MSRSKKWRQEWSFFIGDSGRRRYNRLDEIIKDGAISDANLRLLVDNIVIHESDGKLSINIDLKAAFSSHLNLYDEDGILAAKAYAAN